MQLVCTKRLPRRGSLDHSIPYFPQYAQRAAAGYPCFFSRCCRCQPEALHGKSCAFIIRAEQPKREGKAGAEAEDRENFILLLAELRAAMDSAFGPGRKSLTACASGAPDTLARQDWAGAAQYLDLINLMTYDLCGCWAGVSGHASSAEQAKKAVQCMLAQGVAPGTICIGSPFYCTAMRLREKPERPTWDTLAQEDLLELLQTPGWHSAYDARAGGAYLVYDGPDNPFDRWFLSVETARSLGQKLDLIRNAELAGIIVWEASLDTKNHSFAAQLRDTLLR
mgnify:CR=1 FL=1